MSGSLIWIRQTWGTLNEVRRACMLESSLNAARPTTAFKPAAR
jgi:hypothetical protein